MNLDYEDFEDGGMSYVPMSSWLPYQLYKLTPEFAAKQAPKPTYPSRDPDRSELRYWETTHGHVNEVSGRRIYRGDCVRCHGIVLVSRDVSGPEFRGKHPGRRGRWPMYCTNCQELRWSERRDQAREGMARLRRDPSSRTVEFEYRKYQGLH